MKKVVIVGGGISGVFLSILLKRENNNLDITIIEHNNCLLKKIPATGNGKCNFANSGIITDQYNHTDFVKPILDKFNYQDIINYFDILGIKSKQINQLIYPYSESAKTIVNALIKEINRLKINVLLNTNFIDYKDNILITNNGDIPYDYLVISTGGCSYSTLGNDGSVFNTLKKHNYKITNLSPSLCPVRVKENVKSLEGKRYKVNAKLLNNNVLIHEENGELLFKKDGLSGIVIFNLSHYINNIKNKNNIYISIDFVPEYKDIKSDEYDKYLDPIMSNYLINNHLDIHNTRFHFKDFYPFINSQVTSGGVSLENIDNNLNSKIDKNIYFTGEVLDISAICGGYNIMWALSSANKVKEDILNKIK